MQNLTCGFHEPNVLDLKMGRITYDPEASPEKQEHEVSKYPPLEKLGFQITGMMVRITELKCREAIFLSWHFWKGVQSVFYKARSCNVMWRDNIDSSLQCVPSAQAFY